MDTSSITLTDILFFIFASVSIASGIMVITRRNPVSSALYLVLNFFSLAGPYLTLNAQFIAVIQVLVLGIVRGSSWMIQSLSSSRRAITIWTRVSSEMPLLS